jgi:hypothetical protein
MNTSTPNGRPASEHTQPIHAMCPEHGHPAISPTTVIHRDELQREALCICAYGHAWIERWHTMPESEAS